VTKQKPVLFSAIFIAISFLSIRFLNPIYGTTDDYILDSWMNGNMTGFPEKDAIFVTGLFSRIISFFIY
jgi:hypothetical protein